MMFFAFNMLMILVFRFNSNSTNLTVLIFWNWNHQLLFFLWTYHFFCLVDCFCELFTMRLQIVLISINFVLKQEHRNLRLFQKLLWNNRQRTWIAFTAEINQYWLSYSFWKKWRKCNRFQVEIMFFTIFIAWLLFAMRFQSARVWQFGGFSCLA